MFAALQPGRNPKETTKVKKEKKEKKSMTENNRRLDQKEGKVELFIGPNFWCFNAQGQFEGPKWLG